MLMKNPRRMSLLLFTAFLLVAATLNRAGQAQQDGEVKKRLKPIDPAVAVKKLEQFLGRFPDRGPGFAVVVVTPDETLLKYTDGVRRASTNEPITNDTPIYIASQTKAYVGMLAARLDAEGILSLDDKITKHWPDVKFPEGVDPSDYTLRDLLGHKVPIEVGFITNMEAYICDLDPNDYPALIKEYGEARNPGFRYDNLGYNIWAAILHKATGKSWRTWLDEKIFDPLKLEHSSSRTSDFELNQLAWSHQWQGKEKGWLEVRPKTDGMMQSAGGLVTSVNDMGRWLQANLKGATLKGTGLTEAIVDEAHQSVVAVDGRSPYELPSIGYALGWNIVDFEGYKVYMHGGGYTGARTVMAFCPELNIGIGVFSNSDNMTGWLTHRTAVMYLQYLTDHPIAGRMADIREKDYPRRIARLLEFRQNDIQAAIKKPEWEGWKWNPSENELQDYVGKYLGKNKYEHLDVRIDDGKLIAQIGDRVLNLKPAKKDLFGATTNAMEGFDAVQFKRNSDGEIESVVSQPFTLKRLK